MNKTLKNVLLVIVGIFITYNIVSLFGILKVYTTSTIGNEPNLKLNSKIVVSNLTTSNNGDFICYNYDDKVFGKGIRVHRLCGKENDTLEIINGITYLNRIDIDKKINLIHFYEISTDQYLKIKQAEKISDENLAIQVDEKNVRTLLENSVAKKYGITSKRVIDKKEETDKYIERVFKKNWNKDNFGPLIIPSGKVFVLGDNRDNSEDSRYIGLINQSEIVGGVIYN